MSELLPRPTPPRSAAERARSWLEWFGPGRLVAGAIATVIVVAGAWWLVRTPAPPTEATLPMTAGASPGSSVDGSGSSAGASTTALAGATASTAPGGVPASTTPSTVLVHVAGAVAAPGVHELPAGARVIDAVGAAGGATADADPDALNLAAPVADGQRIYVPRVGEAVPPSAPAPVAAPGSTSPTGPVDLNRADAAELDTLPGIGPATAAAIVEHRERAGPFASVDDLLDVRGIGPAKLDAIRGLVTV